jgi:Protein of unknown function (DUF1822)
MNLNVTSIPLPLTPAAIALANTAAAHYSSPQKSQQIRLNTLAILVMNDFLNLLQVKTDVKQGDSWGKLAALMDTADLVLPDFGKLECRPIAGSVNLDLVNLDPVNLKPPVWPKTVHVPAEVWDDRIGFVMIQIDEAQQMAELLGFAQTVATEDFPLDQLQPMTALVDRLEALQPQTARSPIPAIRLRLGNVVDNLDRSMTRLGDWFHETLEAGWQSIETITLAPAFAFRLREPLRESRNEDATFRICRGKVINLDVGHDVDERALTRSIPRQVSLIVSIQPITAAAGIPETQVTLSFYPVSPELSLPVFHAAIRDEGGVIHYEGDAEPGDEFLEFEFSCGGGDRFDLVLSGSEFQIVESFTL